MIPKFEKFEAILAKIQSIFFCIVLGFMAIVMFASVIFRYVLNDPLIWSEELTTVMQGALAFAGIGYCCHYKAHTRAVSYTHLDVYKRQLMCRSWPYTSSLELPISGPRLSLIHI